MASFIAKCLRSASKQFREEKFYCEEFTSSTSLRQGYGRIGRTGGGGVKVGVKAAEDEVEEWFRVLLNISARGLGVLTAEKSVDN